MSTGRHIKSFLSYVECISLSFQLAHFNGVYRVVRVPRNYTFAHLHMLVQFLFGWSGGHSHRAEVWSHVALYAKTNKPGEINFKKSGRKMPWRADELEGMRHLLTGYVTNFDRYVALFNAVHEEMRKDQMSLAESYACIFKAAKMLYEDAKSYRYVLNALFACVPCVVQC